MVKMLGCVYKKFLTDERFWGTQICDDVELTVDGVEYDDDELEIPDSAVVRIYAGVVYVDSDMEQEVCSYPAFFKRWQKQQAYDIVVVSVPKSKLSAFKDYVSSIGGKITG